MLHDHDAKEAGKGRPCLAAHQCILSKGRLALQEHVAEDGAVLVQPRKALAKLLRRARAQRPIESACRLLAQPCDPCTPPLHSSRLAGGPKGMHGSYSNTSCS